MSKEKIITDYSDLSDSELEKEAKAGITGTTGNANFTFTHNELTDVTTQLAAYSTALGKVPTGTSADQTAKNTSRVTLINGLRTLTMEINVQAKGDLAKLQTTGFPIAKKSEHVLMGDVEGFVVTRGNNAGSMRLKVNKPSYSTHGTVFAYWDPTLGPTPANIDDWFHRFVNGHSINLTRLSPGKTYPFAAAYKGADSDPLIWSDIVTKMVAD